MARWWRKTPLQVWGGGAGPALRARALGVRFKLLLARTVLVHSLCPSPPPARHRPPPYLPDPLAIRLLAPSRCAGQRYTARGPQPTRPTAHSRATPPDHTPDVPLWARARGSRRQLPVPVGRQLREEHRVHQPLARGVQQGGAARAGLAYRK